jgi:hypothetical protein
MHTLRSYVSALLLSASYAAYAQPATLDGNSIWGSTSSERIRTVAAVVALVLSLAAFLVSRAGLSQSREALARARKVSFEVLRSEVLNIDSELFQRSAALSVRADFLKSRFQRCCVNNPNIAKEPGLSTIRGDLEVIINLQARHPALKPEQRAWVERSTENATGEVDLTKFLGQVKGGFIVVSGGGWDETLDGYEKILDELCK